MKILRKHFLITSFVIAFVLEIFVFNYNAILVYFKCGGFENIEVKYKYDDNRIGVYIDDINKKIYNLKVVFNDKCNDVYRIEIYAKEQKTSDENYTKRIEKNFGIFSSKEAMLKLNTSGKINSISVYFINTSAINPIENGEFIDSMYINVNSFKFDYIRFGIVFLICVLVGISNKEFFNRKIEVSKIGNSKLFKTICIAIATMYCVYMVSDLIIKRSGIFLDENEYEKGENSSYVQYSIFKQTESFLDGKLYIDDDSSELEGLNNPYDISERNKKGIYYLFDIAYHNGKYYQYFSILINLFILPFRIITGKYFYMEVYVAILLFILFIIASIFYKMMVEKYINKCSIRNYLLGYFTFMFATGFECFNRGLPYDLQIMFGEIFFMLSIIIILKIQKSNKKKYFLYCILGISVALIVISKANMIILYIPVIYLYIQMLKSKHYSIIECIRVSIIPIIFVMIIAILQMWYNYARFDSIFEFGAKYQLTIADMMNDSRVSLNRIVYTIMVSLFKMPEISIDSFPFVNEGYIGENNVLSMGEYIYKSDVVGILWLPIIYLLFFKSSVTKNNKPLSVITNLFLISAFLILVVNSIVAGVADRYLIDIRLVLTLSSVLVILSYLENLNDNDKKYIIVNKVFSICAILSIMVILPLQFAYEDCAFKLVDITTIKNMLMFWI